MRKRLKKYLFAVVCAYFFEAENIVLFRNCLNFPQNHYK